MSKLSQKFLISVTIILILIGLLSVFINMNFIERYYLYQEKQQLHRISERLTGENAPLDKIIGDIEQSEDVVLIRVKKLEDNNSLNASLREAFLLQGISFQKYWLWEQDQEDLYKDGSKIKVYNQEKLDYSLLVKYIVMDLEFIAIAKTVPSLDKTLLLINRVNTIVFIGAGILLFFCISLLVYKITSPINKIREVANSIANLQFKTLDIHSNDELELLSHDINIMSERLKESHLLLTEKNQEMETLLANVSHDLKTPISLIKMYASGVKDGLDDGTFIDTIIKQNNKMQHIVEKLLMLAKVKQQEEAIQEIHVSALLHDLISAYSMKIEGATIKIEGEIRDNIHLSFNLDAIYLIFSNALSNAIRYSSDGIIFIKLYILGNSCVFSVENAVSNANLDIKRIWEPFYVAEQSRNDDMSGTGLGLSIVKATCEKHKILYESEILDNFIKFKFTIPTLIK